MIPFLDREEKLPGRWFSGTEGMKTVIISSIFSILVTIVIIILLGFSGWTKHWPFALKMMINPGTIMLLAYILWSFFILHRSGSTRFSVLALFTSGFWGYIIVTFIGIWLRGPNWEIML